VKVVLIIKNMFVVFVLGSGINMSSEVEAKTPTKMASVSASTTTSKEDIKKTHSKV